MNALLALPMLFLAADQEPSWSLANEDNGIKIYRRQKEGETVAQMKAMGLMDASPQEVWKAIRDYPNYPKTMPYTEDSKVLASENGDKTIWFYSVVNAPLVDRRDYVIKILDESDWKDGAGFLKVSWTSSTSTDKDKIVPEREGYVRLKINDGYWLLEPREGGKKTFATYYVYTDPGGSIPKFIANKANSTAVPNVFAAIRKVVAEDRAKGKK
jgi:uncharacterized membrane protein